MKNISHKAPPMIIFMDILFIFLFSTLLEETPGIDVNISASSDMIPGVEIISNDERFWYDSERDKWRDINELLRKYNTSFLFTLPFEALPYDLAAKLNTGKVPNSLQTDDLQIAVTGKAFELIAGLTFIACHTNQGNCRDLKFNITSKGGLDMKSILEENPGLAELIGQ